MRMLRWGLISVLLAPVMVRAADLPVSFTVEEKVLKKQAPAGTLLTFELSTNSACTPAVHTETVAVESVTFIERLKLLKVKGGPNPPRLARIHHVLAGVIAEPEGSFFLKVTGVGVSAVGGTVQ